MRMIKGMLAITLALLLAACGSSGCDAGSSPLTGSTACGTTASGGTTTPVSTATAIDVLSSSPQVGSGDEQVTISAIVKGPGNVSLASTAVTFTTTSGILTSVSAQTDSAGVATAILAAGSNKVNRTLTVNVISGAATGSVNVQVTGTTLTSSGDTTVALGRSSRLSVKATDSKGVAIAGLPVTVSSVLRNGLSAPSVTTDGQGNASVDYTATNSGSDQVSFSGGGATVASVITISGEDFTFVSPAASTLIPVGAVQAVTVRYLVGGAPVSGRTVNFAATAGTFSSASVVTDGSGLATAQISATSASPATIQASLQGAVVALATLPVEFVALTPATLVLQVSQTAVGPNPPGSTLQQAQVIATVRDAQLNPVKGVVVNFNRLVDPSGGNLSQASAVTDSSGQASVNYVSGGLTTSSNGVQLRATVASATSVFGDATLTVNQSSLFVALGTGNTITNLDANTYNKEWTVYVTDANGIAVPNVTLTIKVLPVKYGKGTLAYGAANAATGAAAGWRPVAATYSECNNEDANYNGTLDAGEDFNVSGTLEPGNVISVFPGTGPGTVRTNAEGRATVSLRYAESYVPWVKVRLRAEAVVSGTEAFKEAEFWVIGLDSDFTSSTTAPAGYVSPFGTNACGVPN
jgi:Bacterial Ig-like domain (group 1)